VQPETPELLTNLSLGGIAVLIQRFQIAEDTSEFVAGNTKFVGMSKRLFRYRHRVWGRLVESPEYQCPIVNLNFLSR
jgi:hypothetical protein